MVGGEEVQAASLVLLKSIPGITSLVAANEIKEREYQGTDTVYPCIRVAVRISPGRNSSFAIEREALILVSCYSNQHSSKQCSLLTSAVISGVNGKHLTMSTAKSSTIWFLSSVEPRASQEGSLWRSEVNFRTLLRSTL